MICGTCGIRCSTRKQPETPTSPKRALDPNILKKFTASGCWYRHPLVTSITYTDGGKYIADEAEAYWLLHEIALAQRFEKNVGGEKFQVWKLKVHADRSGTLVCEDGDDNTIYSKAIPFTDFPAEGIILWFSNNVIYLPSEH
jgi:hypothetical protein